MTRASAWVLFFIGALACFANWIVGVILIAVAILMEVIIMQSQRASERHEEAQQRTSAPVARSRMIADIDAELDAEGVDAPTGRWRVSGVDRETRFETSGYYNAASSENAKVMAELKGMVVTKIEVAPATSLPTRFT